MADEHGGPLPPAADTGGTPAGTLGSALEAIGLANQAKAKLAADELAAPSEVAEINVAISLKPVSPLISNTGYIPVIQIYSGGQEYQQYLQWVAAIDFILLRAVALSRGIILNVSEAWRSTERQRELKAMYPAEAAEPGKSRHERGLSIDIDVGAGGRRYVVPNSPAYKFLQEVGPKFGFNVLKKDGRVYEAWHYDHLGDKVYGSVSGLTVNVDASGVSRAVTQFATATVESNPVSSYSVGYVASVQAGNTQKRLDADVARLLRYGAAVSRAALATALKKEGDDLNKLLVRINGFEDGQSLPLFNPDTGVWSDGEPV